jgi:hypothetical protein
MIVIAYIIKVRSKKDTFKVKVNVISSLNGNLQKNVSLFPFSKSVWASHAMSMETNGNR